MDISALIIDSKIETYKKKHFKGSKGDFFLMVSLDSFNQLSHCLNLRN